MTSDLKKQSISMYLWFLNSTYDLKKQWASITEMLASAQFPKNLTNATLSQISSTVCQGGTKGPFWKDLELNFFDSRLRKFG